ncbi:MAG: sulfatase-like hydrolase/transferase [Catalinimonas sp.]
MRPLFALLCLLACAACNPTTTPREEPPATADARPNFIVIQMDDLGWDDLATHGNPYVATPHIDRLAAESVRFEHFYVNAVCAPSRASLLTGRHFLKTGVSHVHGGKDFLNLEERTVADLLRDGGYATGMWGKWHSGHTAGYFPWERGFQEAYMARLYRHRDPFGKLNGAPVAFPGRWSSEVIVDYANDFIERHRDTTFFAYLSFLTCHSPLDAPDGLVAKYEAKGLSRNLATIYGMIELADAQIGRLLDALDEAGLAENTVVMFMSDNGPAIENGKLTDADRALRYVNNYKGHKGNLWENGVKSAFFVRRPGTWAPADVATLADITDVTPTLLDLAGVSGTPSPLDGTSLRDVLGGAGGRDKLTYDWASPGWPPSDQPWTPQGVKDEYRPVGKDTLDYREQILSVRDDSLKLMLNVAQYPNTPPAVRARVLVDTRRDPKEARNVLADYPERAAALEARLGDWFDGVKAAEHAFGAPVVRVEGDTVAILAKTAAALGGELMKTFDWVEGFAGGATYLSFTVNVAEAGTYEIFYRQGDERHPLGEQTLARGRQTLRVEGFGSLGKGDQLNQILLVRH